MYLTDNPQSVKEAVAERTGYQPSEIELRTQQSLVDGKRQDLWVVPGVDAGFWLVDDNGRIIVLTGNE